jgi:hypothetical protein
MQLARTRRGLSGVALVSELAASACVGAGNALP